MSLVSYANSSDSEEDTSDTESGRSNTLTGSNTAESSKTKIFTDLPKPIKAGGYMAEEQDEFLKKKEVQIEIPMKSNQPVKITIPSLSIFDSDDCDEDEPNRKKQKIQASASGLFAFLPPPKSNLPKHLQIIPHILRNKNKGTKVLEKDQKTTPPKEIKYDPYSDESDTDDDIPVPDTYDDATWQKVCGRPKRFVPTIEETVTTNEIEPAPEPVKPYQGLDNQAFKELMGANSKQKKDEIDVIDINEDEILPDKDIWMTKSLTDPELAPKYVVEDPVNDTCRRKHHITYLAQQAKANEQDLKNQWAQNRYTRQRTQAKYGF